MRVPPPTRRPPSRAGLVPDALLALVGAGLLVLAAVMVVTDYARELDRAAQEKTLGVPPHEDHAYRGAWVFILILLLGAATVAILARGLIIASDPRMRRWTARAFTMLLIGDGLADLAFAVDRAGGLDAPYVTRAVFVDPLYALGGFLVLGAAYRLATLTRPKSPGDPDSEIARVSRRDGQSRR